LARPRTIFLGGALAIACAAAAGPAAAQSKCDQDASRLRKAERELPKLEVAPPHDRQIVCITLETNILFARRLAAHVRQCPRSAYARSAQTWQQTERSYGAQFKERGCKPAIRDRG
jgi:hypothetical protein